MQNITLNINRKSSFVGAAMPYRIFLNGTEIAKIGNGKSVSIEIPAEQAALKVSMVGNAITLHRIEKEVVLFPQSCPTNIIDCQIETKANWLGVLTYGLLSAVGRVELKMDYR